MNGIRNSASQVSGIVYMAAALAMTGPLTNPVLAASFNCDKAGTKIERLICDNPDISQLDEELTLAYRKALNASSADGIRQAQKQWLRERNTCGDEQCLRQAYRSRIDTIGAAQTSVATPNAAIGQDFESVARQFRRQLERLKTVQSHAKKVLYFDDTMPSATPVGYCDEFWRALSDNSLLDPPMPEMVAKQPREKQALFDVLHRLASSNHERFLALDGKLTPARFTNEHGRSEAYAPYSKGKINNIADLPKKFQAAWQSSPDVHGFFDKDDLLDPQATTHFLYRMPYPLAGFVRPLLISVMEDDCQGCGDLSIGLHLVGIDGIPNPEWMDGKYFSESGFPKAQAEWSRRRVLNPGKSYVLAGITQLGQRLLFWTLKREKWVEPSARELGDIYYFKPGDMKDYFRNFELDVYQLDNPGNHVFAYRCSINFNQ